MVGGTNFESSAINWSDWKRTKQNLYINTNTQTINKWKQIHKCKKVLKRWIRIIIENIGSDWYWTDRTAKKCRDFDETEEIRFHMGPNIMDGTEHILGQNTYMNLIFTDILFHYHCTKNNVHILF